MRIILLRHGNTFAPGDKVVWAGCGQDFPLVGRGVEQAREAGAALKSIGFQLDRIYCAPLLRTREYAEIVSDVLKLRAEPALEPRLTEIDYGSWGGLSNEETAERFGAENLSAWTERAQWPVEGWGGSEAETAAEVREFAEMLIARHGPGDQVAVVSSNGRLRYFLKLVEGEWERRISERSFSMRTGAMSELIADAGRFSVAYWNLPPAGVVRAERS